MSILLHRAGILAKQAVGGGGFSPSDLASLRAWHVADDLALTNDAAVATLSDSSGQGRHATYGGSDILYKTNVVNGHAAVLFPGGVGFQYADNAFDSLTGGATGFVVVKLANDPPGATSKIGLWRYSNADFTCCYPFTDGVVYDDFFSANRKTTGNPTPSMAAWHVYETVSVASDWRSYFNGTSHYSTASNTVSIVGQPTIGVSAPGQGVDGHIAEVVICDGDIGSTDRASVRGYLGTKYGITVA